MGRIRLRAVLLTLEQLGSYALLLLAPAVALFIAVKWRNRRRFLMQIHMDRLSPEELETLMRKQSDFRIVDVRSAEQRARSGWIPGSIHAADVSSLQLDNNSEVVVYCDCPNNASAAVAARRLKEKSFAKVRPLASGIDAWRRGGYKLDRGDPPSP